MMKVIQNLLPVSYSNELESVLCSGNFDWYWNKEATISGTNASIKDCDYNPNIKSTGSLNHTAYEKQEPFGQIQQSNYYQFLKPILWFLEQREGIVVNELLRIRLRRTLQLPGVTDSDYNIPHVDLAKPLEFTTMVYVVEETDGDTVMFNEYYKEGDTGVKTDVTVLERIKPVKNNAIVFNGHQYHAGNNPINYQTRTIINFDFTTK